MTIAIVHGASALRGRQGMAQARPRLDAMRPKQEGPTRTADPRPPDEFPLRGGYRAYLLFGSCGAFLLLTSLIAIDFMWALVRGEARFEAFITRIHGPAHQAYFWIAFAALTWFTLRFLSLFPKTLPVRVSLPVIRAVLYAAFVGANLIVGALLCGALP